jgi:tyrosyl-tRNA synthetase
LGHKVILLIGDFTAMIGDPTDKAATRKKLTREEVLENCKLYKQQASFLLDFDGSNAAEFRFNSEWLAKMSFADVVELASHFTVQQMMERDMFEKRHQEGKPIHLHEFFYPLMQGYDSVALEVDLEIGGNDQTFNMLAGRTLLKTLKQKDKFVLTNRLLTDPTGKKMGKSEGNMISFLDSPEDMYGKVMSWTDEMIVPAMEICTTMGQDLPDDSIASANGLSENYKKLIRENPYAQKKRLAHQIVYEMLGADRAKGVRERADKAAEYFTHVHAQGEKPDEIDELALNQPTLLIDVLVEAGFVTSKADARRQIEQGGVKVSDAVVMDIKAVVEPTADGVVIQKGKRHFVNVVKK